MRHGSEPVRQAGTLTLTKSLEGAGRTIQAAAGGLCVRGGQIELANLPVSAVASGNPTLLFFSRPKFTVACLVGKDANDRRVGGERGTSSSAQGTDVSHPDPRSWDAGGAESATSRPLEPPESQLPEPGHRPARGWWGRGLGATGAELEPSESLAKNPSSWPTKV